MMSGVSRKRFPGNECTTCPYSTRCQEGLIMYFLGEGGMDHTVHLTVPYPIVVNCHAKFCV
jgi:hypothetical protein